VKVVPPAVTAVALLALALDAATTETSIVQIRLRPKVALRMVIWITPP